VMMAFFWFKQSLVAAEKLAKGGSETKEFYTAKIQTAEFYFDRLLPRANGHYTGMMATSTSTMQIHKDHFAMA